MTPQERTELQRLAEALELARILVEKKVFSRSPTDQAHIMASALLSLAAESEELRAELERAENECRALISARNPEEIGRLIDAAVEHRTSALESRYAVLENAGTAHRQAAEELLKAQGFPGPSARTSARFRRTLGALAAALTPKEGE